MLSKIGSSGAQFTCDQEWADCDEIKRLLAKVDLRPAWGIFVESRDKLVKRFSGDENVYYRLAEEGNVAMYRDCDDAPHLLIAADRHHDSTPEMAKSILHELQHAKGITDEREAERLARQQFKKLK